MHTLQRIVAGLVAVVALLAGIEGFRTVSSAVKLRNDYATTRGTITSNQAGQHGIVDYTFAVNGVEYHGRGVGGAERAYDSGVTIYYSRKEPSISSLHDPLVWASPGWPSVAIPRAIALFCLCIAIGAIRLPKTGNNEYA